MRDAFGGIFMIRLMLVFIVIYVAFAAISLNYAKAFKIKNRVIDYVEQNEIIDIRSYLAQGNRKNINALDEILDSANYKKECRNGNGVIDNVDGEPDGYCYRGIVFQPIKISDRYIEYQVSTYADWNLGTLNMLLALGGENKNYKSAVSGAWEISGEAKVVIRKESEMKK